MNFARKFVVLVTVTAACGDNEPMMTVGSAGPTSSPSTTTSPVTSAGTSATSADTSAPTSGTSSAEGAPVFLSFSSNVATLTQDESVTFTAILTDPDGVEDIAGGVLRNADESIEFGPFMAAGQPGAYSLVLSWSQIHQAAPIQFENGEDLRGFRAVFFDQKGLQAADKVELALVCPGGAACAGTCTDLALDGLHCGTCGRVCDGGKDACDAGKCSPAVGECVYSNVGPITCAEICQSAGETCVFDGCPGTLIFYFFSSECEMQKTKQISKIPCDQAYTWPPGSQAIRCCCTDTK